MSVLGTPAREQLPKGEARATTALVTLTGVGKDYPKIDSTVGRVRLLWRLLRGHAVVNVFRAVEDVSFELRRGESLGVIGENGAGKSTLLKIIAGVIKPTRGSVAVNGRVSALLELGSGFHPDYSGLANIDLAAALLGLAPDEIAAKRREIVEFADIGEHIHDPIKHYSSGMVVRLGFAVATALRPDVLITDEVLAVGDESFQKRCIAWIERYLGDGGTLVLCSHGMYHVQKLCDRALWLKDGRVEAFSSAMEVTQAYLAYHETKSLKQRQAIPESVAAAAGWYAVQSFTLQPADAIEAGGSLRVCGQVYSPDGRSPSLAIGVVRADGTPVYGVTTDMDNVELDRIGPDRFAFALEFPRLPLLPGKYFVRAHALDPECMRMFDAVELPLTVRGTSRELGLVKLSHEWVH